jgi:flagellar hook assembly protein FlgD
MSNSKNVAWSTEMTETLSATYTGDNTQLEAIAQEFNKSVPMVRSKLVSMKIYVPNTAVRKVGSSSAVRKISQVRSAETMLSLPIGSLESFDKATKQDLSTLLDALISLSDHQAS